MRKTIIRSVSILGILLVLVTALIAFIRFYPYTYNFPAYPKITHTQSGAEGDPLNLVFIGSKDQIAHSFQQAGWLIPDPITLQTSEKIAVAKCFHTEFAESPLKNISEVRCQAAGCRDSLRNFSLEAYSLTHKSYPTAPVSNLYVFGRVQDLAFEKSTNDVANRGHIRLWKTGTLIGRQLVWIGEASYDSGIELSGTNHLPTHHIAPTVDLERNAVGADLGKTGLVKEEADAAFTPPIVYARNGGGDYYASDGDVLVINYTPVPIPLNQSVWVIDGLKTGVFLFYDALFTVVGALIAFLVLVAVLTAGLALWRLTERNRTMVRT